MPTTREGVITLLEMTSSSGRGLPVAAAARQPGGCLLGVHALRTTQDLPLPSSADSHAATMLCTQSCSQ